MRGRSPKLHRGDPFRGVGGISLSAVRRQIAWGYSTVGSAIRSQRIGHEFESRYLHQVAARRILKQLEFAQAVFFCARSSRAVEPALLLFPRICAGALNHERLGWRSFFCVDSFFLKRSRPFWKKTRGSDFLNKVFIGVFTNDCRYDTMITIKNLFKNGKKFTKQAYGCHIVMIE